MKIPHADANDGLKTGGPKLRAARAVCRDGGFSTTTLWRRIKCGLIKAVNIYGKLYVDMDSLADFERRAAAGEFAKSPTGCALTARERAKARGKQKGTVA